MSFRNRPNTAGRGAAAALVAALVSSLLVTTASPALAAPTVSVSDAEIAEGGTSDSPILEFTITLSEPASSTVTVRAFTADGTARVIDGDYDARDLEVDFAIDQQERTVSVPVNGDDVQEGDETLTLNLSDADGATIDDGTGVGTILNDDGPTITLEAAVSQTEGGAGSTRTATLTVTADWSGVSDRVGASVGFATAPDDPVSASNGDETLPDDYEAAAGRVTIPVPDPDGGTPDTSTAEIDVTIIGDDLYEGGSGTFETFLVVLSDPAFAVLGTPETTTATISIEDDEEEPTVAIGDGQVIEGDADTSPGTLTVSLSHPSQTASSVQYGTADGTATNAGGDYVPISSATVLDIPALTTDVGVTVEAKGDADEESNETFSVSLSTPDGVQLPEGGASGTMTVLNDDGPVVAFARTDGQPTSTPTLERGDLALPEGDAGELVPFVFTVELSDAVGEDVTVGYATTDGTANASSGGETRDYESASGSVVIPAGQTTAEVTVTVNGDDFPGLTEWFYLDLTSVSGGGVTILDDRATGTLISDDGPVVDVADVTMTEGDSGSATVQLSFSIDPPYTSDTPGCDSLDCDVTFRYATVDGTATTDDGDYTAAEGTVTIPEGSTSASLELTVHRDTTPEADESFAVRLSEPAFAVLGPNDETTRDVTVTIVNDDGPTVRIGDVSVTEGDDGTVDAVFPVTLSEPATEQVEVAFATTDGTAKASDDDYIARSGTVKILPGGSSATVTVKVIGDLRFEGDETFRLVLSDAAFAVLGSDRSGTATIANDDADSGSSTDGGTDGTTDGGTDGTTGAGTDAATDGGSDGGSPPPAGTVTRASGKDRILTAVDVSATHWSSAPDVVLATAYNYPDALAGGALAAELDAPLLLTDADAVPSAVVDELARLGTQRVWILGGTAAVSRAVEDALDAAGYDVHRLQGTDRFATAAAVAAKVGLPASGEVAIALGYHVDDARAWPDALSAGSLAASAGRLPTLLTLADDLPTATEQALADLGAERVLLIGGTVAIGTGVEDELRALGYDVVRLAGTDRYGTSVDVADEALARAPATGVPVVFATGANYPDGLAAAALAARLGGIVVLVNGTDQTLHPGVDAFLRDHAAQLTGGVVVGGTTVLTEDIRTQLRAALGG